MQESMLTAPDGRSNVSKGALKESEKRPSELGEVVESIRLYQENINILDSSNS
jgi:hypothetical protein